MGVQGGRPRSKRSRGGRGGYEPRTRIAEREARAVDLANRGVPQREIAKALEISQPAVSKILARIHARLVHSTHAALLQRKAEQDGQLRFLYAQHIAGWDRSCADRSRRRQRRTEQDTGGTGAGGRATTVSEVAVEPASGNAEFLEGARRVLGDLRRLWGIDAPKEISLRAGRPLESLTDEELAQKLDDQDALSIRPALRHDALKEQP